MRLNHNLSLVLIIGISKRGCRNDSFINCLFLSKKWQKSLIISRESLGYDNIWPSFCIIKSSTEIWVELYIKSNKMFALADLNSDGTMGKYRTTSQTNPSPKLHFGQSLDNTNSITCKDNLRDTL